MSSAKHFTEEKSILSVALKEKSICRKYLPILIIKSQNVQTVKDTENRVQTQGMSFLHLILQMIILKQRNREIPWKAISNSRIKRCMI